MIGGRAGRVEAYTNDSTLLQFAPEFERAGTTHPRSGDVEMVDRDSADRWGRASAR